MRRIIVILPLVLVLGSAATLHATLAIPTVEVGNPGNVHDSSGFGGVGNTYSIGKHEVTNSQYIEFLNAVDPTGGNGLGLYSDLMTSNANGGIAFSPSPQTAPSTVPRRAAPTIPLYSFPGTVRCGSQIGCTMARGAVAPRRVPTH